MGVHEHVLDCEIERRGDAEGEVKAGVVALGLQGVDREAGHADAGAELLLGPAPIRPQDLETALQDPVREISGVTTPNSAQTSG